MSIALDINIENRAKEISKEVLKSIVYENIDKGGVSFFETAS